MGAAETRRGEARRDGRIRALPSREGAGRGVSPKGRGDRGRCRRAASAAGLHRARARRPQHQHAARAALRHLHDAAGGVGALGLQRAQDDDLGAAALRGRPHHLHAHRLHQCGGRGVGQRPRPHRRELRQALPPGCAQCLSQQGRRPGSPRGDSPHRLGRARAGRRRSRRPPSLRFDLAAVRRVADDARRIPGQHRDRGRRRVRAARPGPHPEVRRLHAGARAPQRRRHRLAGLRRRGAARAP